MRVGGSGNIRSGGIRAKGTKKAAGGFSVNTETKTGAAKGPGAMGSVSSVDALLALQEVDDPTTGRRRAMKRGERILDVLEDVQLSLLAGEISRKKLDELLKAVESQKDHIEHQELSDLLDHIELRARVEIAKYEKNNQ